MSLYFYSKKEQIPKNVSIKDFKDIFIKYSENKPTLEEALYEMFLLNKINEKKSNELVNDIIKRSDKFIKYNYEIIKENHPLLSEEEARIISSYKIELKEKKYSPYVILNKNLCEEDREKGINNVSKYLFLFLKSLRKLLRYYPKKKFMHRCVEENINIKEDLFNKKIEPFKRGIKKTFYGFTSITSKIEDTFINKADKNKIGSVFDLYGNFWGYDISLFNKLLEEEIILEPETTFLVMNAIPSTSNNKLIHIKCKIESSPVVLKEIVKPDGLKLIYKIYDKDYKKFSFIRIFGTNFVKNNRNYLKYIYKNEEYELTDFFNCSKLKNNYIEILLKGISEINDLSNMFCNVEYLISIQNIELLIGENFSYMFSGCKSLSFINEIPKLNTSYTKNLSYIFHNCKLLEELPDISNWDTSNIINMSHLFEDCQNLSSLPNISKWRVDNVKDMSYIFSNCKSLEELIDLSNWDISNVENMSHMFNYCTQLKSINNTYKWRLLKVKKISYMFSNCSSLKDISAFDDTNLEINIINMEYLFNNCKCLTSLPNISKLKTNLVNNMSYIFSGCESLIEIPDISKWDLSRVTEMQFMFNNCKTIKAIPDISQWNVSNVKNMDSLFKSCKSLIKLPDISRWNVSNVLKMTSMFNKCQSLLYLPDISFWYVNEKVDLTQIISDCGSLLEIPNITKWKLKNSLDEYYNFRPYISNCYSLFVNPFNFYSNNCINLIA